MNVNINISTLIFGAVAIVLATIFGSFTLKRIAIIIKNLCNIDNFENKKYTLSIFVFTILSGIIVFGSFIGISHSHSKGYYIAFQILGMIVYMINAVMFLCFILFFLLDIPHGSSYKKPDLIGIETTMEMISPATFIFTVFSFFIIAFYHYHLSTLPSAEKEIVANLAINKENLWIHTKNLMVFSIICTISTVYKKYATRQRALARSR